MDHKNCCQGYQTIDKWNVDDDPGISTPGMMIDTDGVSKTVGKVDTSVHVMKIMAPKATTIPRFMYHLQNLGEKLEIPDIIPLRR